MIEWIEKASKLEGDFAEIIIVDDINRRSHISQVPQAVQEFIKQTNRNLIILDRWAILTR